MYCSYSITGEYNCSNKIEHFGGIQFGLSKLNALATASKIIAETTVADAVAADLSAKLEAVKTTYVNTEADEIAKTEAEKATNPCEPNYTFNGGMGCNFNNQTTVNKSDPLISINSTTLAQETKCLPNQELITDFCYDLCPPNTIRNSVIPTECTGPKGAFYFIN